VPEFEAAGIPVVTLGMRHGIPDPRHIWKLMRIVKSERPAVIQGWMYHANLIGGLAAKASGSIPMAWGIHHTNLSPAYIKRPTLMIAKACVPLSKRLPGAIVCVAEASRAVHTELGYATDRMMVIPNGFDVDRFKPDPAARLRIRQELGLAPDVKLAGLLARFNPQKDHRNFVEAAKRVAAADPGVHFVLCGWDVSWENAQLSSWVEATGIRDRFHLLGRRSDSAAINASLDVSCLSSESGEAFPMVIGEAMASGVPCAVTDIGDSARIVGDLGRVAPPRDPAALAEGMLELLSLSAGERERIALACRQRIVDNFSLDAVARQYDELWTRLEARVPVAQLQRDLSCA
jgi:glycosyltransferase involved in cell wall biosynthesis